MYHCDVCGRPRHICEGRNCYDKPASPQSAAWTEYMDTKPELACKHGFKLCQHCHNIAVTSSGDASPQSTESVWYLLLRQHQTLMAELAVDRGLKLEKVYQCAKRYVEYPLEKDPVDLYVELLKSVEAVK